MLEMPKLCNNEMNKRSDRLDGKFVCLRTKLEQKAVK